MLNREGDIVHCGFDIGLLDCEGDRAGRGFRVGVLACRTVKMTESIVVLLVLVVAC